MKIVLVLSLASLASGLLFWVFAVAALGTPPFDVGMFWTAVVFVLFGVFGLLLYRVRAQQAAAGEAGAFPPR